MEDYASIENILQENAATDLSEVYKRRSRVVTMPAL